jgi:hypothetical protein
LEALYSAQLFITGQCYKDIKMNKLLKRLEQMALNSHAEWCDNEDGNLYEVCLCHVYAHNREVNVLVKLLDRELNDLQNNQTV